MKNSQGIVINHQRIVGAVLPSVVVLWAVVLWAVVVSCQAYSPVTLTGTNYIENFNGVGLELPAGWSVKTNASALNLGSPVSPITNATSWASTTAQFVNFAGTLGNDGTPFTGSESPATQSAATNRCLGVRQSGSFGDPGAAFVLQLQNTSGLKDFQVTLDFDLLNVQSRSVVWTIDYTVGNSPGSFTSIGTYTDSGIFGSTNKTFSFGTALDNQSQNVWIRIAALSASTGTGSRDTLGIDNFTLHYSAQSPIPLDIKLVGTNAVLNWTNPAFGLQAAPAVNGTYTN